MIAFVYRLKTINFTNEVICSLGLIDWIAALSLVGFRPTSGTHQESYPRPLTIPANCGWKASLFTHFTTAPLAVQAASILKKYSKMINHFSHVTQCKYFLNCHMRLKLHGFPLATITTDLTVELNHSKLLLNI